MAVIKPAYVFNNARLYPASTYAPPAVGPYFEGLFGVGYTQKNLTKQFEYTVKQMAVSPFSVNSNKHIKNIRDKYGYSDNGVYETMGVIGGVVGAGVGAMIGSGLMQIKSPLAKASFWKASSWQNPFTFNKLEDAIPKRTAAKQLYKALPEVDTFVKETQNAITKEISLVIEKQGDKITRELIEEAIDRGADSVSGKVIKGIKPEKIKQVTETIKNKTKASMPDNAIDNLIDRIHKSAKNYLNLQTTKDALALAINEAVEKAIKEIDVSSIEKLTATLVAEKMAKEGGKTLSDDAIKTIKIIATETITKKVTEEVTEEVTDKFVKEAAEVATKELTEEVAAETTTKVAKKGAGIAPHIGVAIDVASLGFSIAGLVQSIEQGDALNIVFNSVLAVADTADLAGNFIPGFGTALSVIAGIVSIGATMLQGWLVGQTIGKSFSAEGAQAQALFAENLYASTINRPISSIGTILTMIAVPALTSVLGKGVGSSNAILRTASFLPDWLSTSALGNQVRAGISMMAVQGMNQIAAPIDNALPWAADDPNDINFVSAVSLYGDINDNLYGATRNKAILKGLITNDSKAMTDAMARAWGYSDEMTYAINFDDVRQATKFDGGPFVNALIGVIGEMVIDPQNMYEVAYANSAEKVINEGVKIAERKLRRLQAQDILYKDVGEYTILFGEQGLFKNNAARNTYLKRLLKAKLDDGAKGVQETGANLFSHRFKGTQIKALYPQVGAQLTLINKLFDDILSGETFLTDEVDTTLKFKQSLQELYTLKNKTDNTTDIEKQASIDALNTYKKLLTVYAADDDINLITSKVVDDYALTVRDSNIKSLYKNYSSFKAHMDMTDMLARGILKFGNPIGHVFKLGISKGIPRAASDIFRRFFGKNKQQTIISVDEALAEHDEILNVINKKIVELREKQKRDTDLIERLTREREDNTERTSEVVQAVEDVSLINENIKRYNEELDIMKEILDGWNALHEQVKNERALAATITYDYNGKTYTMNAAEEQRIISNIKKYEGTMDKEALAKTIKEGKRTKDIPTLEYLREKELYNTHKLNTKGGDSFLGIVAYMKTMTSLLAQTQLTVEETRTKVLKSMQYILSYANTYTKKPITEVLDEHIGNLRAKIKTSSDAIIELEASKVSTVSDAEDKINKDINAKIAGHKSNIKTKSEELKNVLKRRNKLFSEQDIIDRLADVRKYNKAYNRAINKKIKEANKLPNTDPTKEDLLKKLNKEKDNIKSKYEKDIEKLNNTVPTKITTTLRAFDLDAYEMNMSDVKGVNKILADNGIITTVVFKDGTTKEVTPLEVIKDSDDFVKVEFRAMRSTKQIINGAIATALGDKYPKDFLKYKSTEDFPTVAAWKKMSTEAKVEFLLTYIGEIGKYDVDSPEILKLLDGFNFFDLYEKMNKLMNQDERPYTILEDVDESTIQEQVMQQLLSGEEGAYNHEVFKTVIEAYEQLDNKLRSSFNKDNIPEFYDEIQFFVEQANSKLMYNTTYKYLNTFYNRKTPLQKGELSFFVKQEVLREQFLDMTKVKNFTKTGVKPYVLKEALKEIGEDTNGLLNVLVDSYNLEEDMNYIKHRIRKPQLNQKIDGVVDMDITTIQGFINVLKQTDTPENKEDISKLEDLILRKKEIDAQELNDHRQKVMEAVETNNIVVSEAVKAVEAQEESRVKDKEKLKIISLLSDPRFKNMHAHSLGKFETPETVNGLLRRLFRKNTDLEFRGVMFTIKQQNFIEEDAKSVEEAISFGNLMKKNGQSSKAHEQAVKEFARKLANLVYWEDDKQEVSINKKTLVGLNKGEKDNEDSLARRIAETYLEGTRIDIYVNRTYEDVYGNTKSQTGAHYGKKVRNNFEIAVIEYYRDKNIILLDNEGNSISYDKTEAYIKEFYKVVFEDKNTTFAFKLDFIQKLLKKSSEETTNDVYTTRQRNISSIAKSISDIEKKIIYGQFPFHYAASADMAIREAFANERLSLYTDDLLNVRDAKDDHVFNTTTFTVLHKFSRMLVEDFAHKKEPIIKLYKSWELNKEKNEIYFITEGAKPKSISLLELLIRYRFNKSNFNVFLNSISRKMAEQNVSGNIRRTQTLERAKIESEFDRLYNILNKFISFNTFDISEEAFRALPENANKTPEEIKAAYEILSDPDLELTYNSLTFNPSSGADYDNYKHALGVYKEIISKSNKETFEIEGTFNGKPIKRTFNKQERTKAMVYAILVNKDIPAEAKKKLLLDVFFYDMKIVRGVADDNTLGKNKARLAIEEKKLANLDPQNTKARVMTAIKIRKLESQIKFAEDNGTKFKYYNDARNISIKDKIYEDVFLKDPEKVLEILENIKGRNDKQFVVAQKDGVSYYVRRQIVGKTVEDNTIDVSRGLPGYNANIIEFVFNGNKVKEAEAGAKALPAMVVDVVAGAMIGTEYEIKAAGTDTLLIVTDKPKVIQNRTEIKDQLKKVNNAYTEVYFVDAKQYNEIVEMVNDPNKYTEEEEHLIKDTTVFQNMIINVASDKVLNESFMEDLDLLNRRTSTARGNKYFEDLKEFNRLKESGLFKMSSSFNKGTSFYNTETFARLEQHAKLHKAYKKFLDGFGDVNLTEFNIEKISLAFFNNYFIKTLDAEDITSELLLSKDYSSIEMFNELSEIKINGIPLVDLIVRSLKEMNNEYKNSNDIYFDYRAILSNEVLNDIFSLESALKEIITVMKKQFNYIDKKVISNADKVKDKIQINMLNSEELEDFFHTAAPLLLSNGSNILKMQQTKLLAGINSIKENYNKLGVETRVKGQERVKYYTDKRAAEYQALYGGYTKGFEYSLLYKNFISKSSYTKYDIETIKKYIEPATIDELYNKLPKEDADSVLKEMLSMYLKHLYNAGMFIIVDKDPVVESIPLAVLTIQRMYEDMMKQNRVKFKSGVPDNYIKIVKNLHEGPGIFDPNSKEAIEILADYLAMKALYKPTSAEADEFYRVYDLTLNIIKKEVKEITGKRKAEASFRYYDPFLSENKYTLSGHSSDLDNIFGDPRIVIDTDSPVNLYKRPSEKGETLAKHLAKKYGDKTIEPLLDKVINNYEVMAFSKNYNKEAVIKEEVSLEDYPLELRKFRNRNEYIKSLSGPEKEIANQVLKMQSNKKDNRRAGITFNFKTPEGMSVDEFSNTLTRISNNIDILNKYTSEANSEKFKNYKNVQEILYYNDVSLLNKNEKFMEYFRDVLTGKQMLSNVDNTDKDLLRKVLGIVGTSELDLIESKNIQEFIGRHMSTATNNAEFFALMAFVNGMKNLFITAELGDKTSYKKMVDVFERAPIEKGSNLSKTVKTTGIFGGKSFYKKDLLSKIYEEHAYLRYAKNRKSELDSSLRVILPTKNKSPLLKHTFKPTYVVAIDSNVRKLTMNTRTEYIKPLFVKQDDVDIFGQETIQASRDMSEGVFEMFLEDGAKDYKSVGSSSPLYNGLRRNFSELFFKVFPTATPDAFIKIQYLTAYIKNIKEDRSINGYYLGKFELAMAESGTTKEEVDLLIKNVIDIFDKNSNLVHFDSKMVKGLIGFVIEAKHSKKTVDAKVADILKYQKERAVRAGLQYKLRVNDNRREVLNILDASVYNDEQKIKLMYELIFLEPYTDENENSELLRTALNNYNNAKKSTRIKDGNIFDTKDFMDLLKKDYVAESNPLYNNLLEAKTNIEILKKKIASRNLKFESLTKELKDAGVLQNDYINTYETTANGIKVITQESLDTLRNAFEELKETNKAKITEFKKLYTPKEYTEVGKKIKEAENEYKNAMINSSEAVKARALEIRRRILESERKDVSTKIENIEASVKQKHVSKAYKEMFESRYPHIKQHSILQFLKNKFEGVLTLEEALEYMDNDEHTEAIKNIFEGSDQERTYSNAYEILKTRLTKAYEDKKNYVGTNKNELKIVKPYKGDNPYDVVDGKYKKYEDQLLKQHMRKESLNRAYTLSEEDIMKKLDYYKEMALKEILAEIKPNIRKMNKEMYNAFFNTDGLFEGELTETQIKKIKKGINKRTSRLTKAVETNNKNFEEMFGEELTEESYVAKLEEKISIYSSIKKKHTKMEKPTDSDELIKAYEDRFFKYLKKIYAEKGLSVDDYNKEVSVVRDLMNKSTKKEHTIRELLKNLINKNVLLLKYSDMDVDKRDVYKQYVDNAIREYAHYGYGSVVKVLEGMLKRYKETLEIKSTEGVTAVDPKENLTKQIEEMFDNPEDRLLFLTWYEWNVEDKKDYKSLGDLLKKEERTSKEYKKLKTAEDKFNPLDTYEEIIKEFDELSEAFKKFTKQYEYNASVKKSEAIPYNASNIGAFKTHYGEEGKPLTNAQAVDKVINMMSHMFTQNGKDNQEDKLREYIEKYGDVDIHNPVVDNLLTYANLMKTHPHMKNIIGLDIETLKDGFNKNVPYMISLLIPQEDGTILLSTMHYSSFVVFDEDKDGNRGELLEGFYKQQKELWNKNYHAAQEDDGVTDIKDLTDKEVNDKFNKLVKLLKGIPSDIREVTSMILLLSNSNKTVVTHNGRKYDNQVYQEFVENFTKRYLINLMDKELKNMDPISLLKKAGITDIDSSNAEQAMQVLEASYKKIIISLKEGKYTSEQSMRVLKKHVEDIIKYIVQQKVVNDIISVEQITGMVLNQEVRKQLLDPESGVIAELKDAILEYITTGQKYGVYELFERGLQGYNNKPETIKNLRNMIDSFLESVSKRYDGLLNKYETLNYGNKSESVYGKTIQHFVDKLNIDVTEHTPQNNLDAYRTYINDLKDRIKMIEEGVTDAEIDEYIDIQVRDLDKANKEKLKLQQELEDIMNSIEVMESEKEGTFADINEAGRTLEKWLTRTVERVNKLLNTKGKDAVKNKFSAFTADYNETLALTKQNAFRNLGTLMKVFIEATTLYKNNPDKLFDPSILFADKDKETLESEIAELKIIHDALKHNSADYTNKAMNDYLEPMKDDLKKLAKLLNLIVDKDISSAEDIKMIDDLNKYMQTHIVDKIEEYLKENEVKLNNALKALNIDFEIDIKDYSTYEKARDYLSEVKDKQTSAYKTAFDLLISKAMFGKLWKQYDDIAGKELTVKEILNKGELSKSLQEVLKANIAAKENSINFIEQLKDVEDINTNSQNKQYLLSLFKRIVTQIETAEDFEQEYKTRNIFNLLYGREAAPESFEEVAKRVQTTNKNKATDPELMKAFNTSRVRVDPYENTDRTGFIPNRNVIHKDSSDNTHLYKFYDSYNDSIVTVTVNLKNQRVVQSARGNYNYYTLDKFFSRNYPDRKSIHIKKLSDIDDLLNNFYDEDKGVVKGLNESNIVKDGNIDRSKEVFEKVSAFMHAIEGKSSIEEIDKTVLDFNGNKIIVNPINRFGANNSIEFVNLTERASKRFVERVSVYEKIKNDFKGFTDNTMGYLALYNESMGAINRLPARTNVAMLPEGFGNVTTILSDEDIYKNQLDILEVSESNANIRAKTRTELSYEPVFRQNLNSIRKMLVSLVIQSNFTSIKVTSEIHEKEDALGKRFENFADHLENKEMLQKQLGNFDIENGDLNTLQGEDRDKAIALRQKLRRNQLLIREYTEEGTKKRSNVFTPNVVSEHTFNLYKHDILVKTGLNFDVTFADIGPAFEDVIAVDADDALLYLEPGQKIWLDDAGYKGTIVPVKNLRRDFGTMFVASKSSAISRGTESLFLKQAMNNIRKFLVGEDNNVLEKGSTAYNILHEKGMKEKLINLIGAENIRDGKLILDGFKDYGNELNKILDGRSYLDLISHKYTQPPTVRYKNADNKFVEEAVNGNVLRGELYVMVDSSHSADKLATESSAIRDNKLSQDVTDKAGSVRHGFILSLTAMFSVRMRLSNEGFEKLFKVGKSEIYEYALAKERGISQLFKVIKDANGNVDVEKTRYEINKIQSKNLLQYANDYFNILLNKNYDEIHREQALLNIDRGVRKYANTALSGGDKSINYSDFARRIPGIRQQVLANTNNDLGTGIPSKAGFEALLEQKPNGWLQEETLSDAAWKEMTTYETIVSNTKYKSADKITFKSKYDLDEYINHINRQGIINTKDKIYVVEDLTLTFKKHSRKFGYVLMVRSPVQTIDAVPMIKIVGYNNHSAIELSPYLYKMMGMDNDGDAVGMTGIDYKDATGFAKNLDATKKSYYKQGYLEGVEKDLSYKDLPIPGSGMEYNLLGKKTYNNKIREVKIITTGELIHQAMPEMFKDLLENKASKFINTKAQNELAKQANKVKLNKLDKRTKKLYANVIVRKLNNEEDFDDTFKSVEDYNNDIILNAFIEDNKDMIKNLIAFDQLYKKQDRKLTYFFKPTEDMYNYNRVYISKKDFLPMSYELLLEQFEKGIMVPTETTEKVTNLFEKILLNKVLNTNEKNTVIRTRTAKLETGETGGPRKQRHIASALVDNYKITNDKDFFKNIGATVKPPIGYETDIDVTIKSLATAVMGSEEYQKAITSKKLLKSIVVTNGALNKYSKDVISYIEKLIIKNINGYIIAKREVAQLIDLFRGGEPPSLEQLQTFLKSSSKAKDEQVRALLSLEDDTDKQISKSTSVDILTMYFGRFKNITKDILTGNIVGNEIEKFVEDVAAGYLNQYLVDNNAIDELDDLAQTPISLIKHGGTGMDYAKHRKAVAEKAKNLITDKSLRYVTVGTDIEHKIQKAYGAEYDVQKRMYIKDDVETPEGTKDIVVKHYNTYNGYKNALQTSAENIMNFALFGNINKKLTNKATAKVFTLMMELNNVIKLKNLTNDDYDVIRNVFKELIAMNINFYKFAKGIQAVEGVLYVYDTAAQKEFKDVPNFTVRDIHWLGKLKNVLEFIDAMLVKDVKKSFLQSADDAIINNFLIGRISDELYVYVNEADGTQLRTYQDIDYVDSDRKTSNSMLDEVLGTQFTKNLDFTQKRIANKVLTDIKLLDNESIKNTEDTYKELKDAILLLFKITENAEEQAKKPAIETDEKNKEEIEVKLTNRYVYNNRMRNKQLDIIADKYNQYIKNKQQIERNHTLINRINNRISILENIIDTSKKAIKNTDETINRKAVLADLKQLVAEKEQMYKEQEGNLLVSSVYENIGSLILLLRNKDGNSVTDMVTNLKPKVIEEPELNQETINKLHTSNILQMDTWQVPFLTQAEIFNNNWDDMYDWLKNSDYRATKLMYAFDDETMAKRLLQYIKRTDKGFKDKTFWQKLNHRPNTKFESVEDLIAFTEDLLKGSDDVIRFDKAEFTKVSGLVLSKHEDIVKDFKGPKINVDDLKNIKDANKETLYIIGEEYYTWNGKEFIEQYGIDQQVTPTLKEIFINSPKDLERIYNHLMEAFDQDDYEAQYQIGFTTTNDMMSAMEIGYRFFELEGKFKVFVQKMQQAQKLGMRLSLGFLFRNATDTVHQLISQLIEEKSLGGTVLSNKEILKYTGLSMKVYSAYKFMSEERMNMLTEVKTYYEDIQELYNKGPLTNGDEKVILDKVNTIKEKLDSYVKIGNDIRETEATSQMKHNIPRAEALLKKLDKYLNLSKGNKIHYELVIQEVKSAVLFLGNMSFAEYFLMYDNHKDTPGLRLDAYEYFDGGRKLKNVRTQKEKYSKKDPQYYEDFKTALFDISAFMNTNAQIDILKQEQFQDLRQIIELHKQNSNKDGRLKTYEEILFEIDYARNNNKGFFQKAFKDPYDATYTEANEFIENSARITAYIYDRFINDYGHDETIQRSLKRWFNYGQRDPIESKLLADIPYLSFPIRSIQNWIDRLFNPSYMRLMSDVIDGIYGQFADDDGLYDKFTLFQIQNGWIPLTKNIGVRISNGAFDVQDILNNAGEIVSQRRNPILNAVLTLVNTGNVVDSLKALASIGILTRSMNSVTGITGTRELAQQTPVVKDFATTKKESPGTVVNFLYDYKHYEKYTPRRYRYPNNGRYRYYENLYKDWFNKNGQLRKPKVDPMSLVKDIQWKQYVRYRRQQQQFGR